MSADLTQYVNLRPLDITPAQVYLDSIEVARNVFPGFELRPGTIEDAMFQAFAYMSSLNIGAINRLPDSLILGLGKMLGTQYVDSEPATMDVTFTANSNDGAIVPLGTIVRYTPSTDDETSSVSYFFETNESITIAANAAEDPLPTGTANCTSRSLGVVFAVDAGVPLSLESYSQELYSAVSAGNFVQGVDGEGLDDFLDRTVTNLSSMSSALVTTSQLNNYVLISYPQLISRSKVYDLTDPEGARVIGEAEVPGKILLCAYGPQRLLTNTEITTINTDISDRVVAGLEVGVVSPVFANFKIVATCTYLSQYDSADVSTLLINNLLTKFSPSSSQWTEERLRYNDVLRFFYSNPSIHSVDSLTISKTDSANITGAVKVGNNVTYTAVNTFSVNDVVTVTGITPSGLNCATKVITARTNTTFTVVNAAATGTYTSGGAAAVTSPNWGEVSGSDILYATKGTLLNLQAEKIVLTLNSISI
jgi:hypothetical protein